MAAWCALTALLCMGNFILQWITKKGVPTRTKEDIFGEIADSVRLREEEDQIVDQSRSVGETHSLVNQLINANFKIALAVRGQAEEASLDAHVRLRDEVNRCLGDLK